MTEYVEQKSGDVWNRLTLPDIGKWPEWHKVVMW